MWNLCVPAPPRLGRLFYIGVQCMYRYIHVPQSWCSLATELSGGGRSHQSGHGNLESENWGEMCVHFSEVKSTLYTPGFLWFLWFSLIRTLSFNVLVVSGLETFYCSKTLVHTGTSPLTWTSLLVRYPDFRGWNRLSAWDNRICSLSSLSLGSPTCTCTCKYSVPLWSVYMYMYVLHWPLSCGGHLLVIVEDFHFQFSTRNFLSPCLFRPVCVWGKYERERGREGGRYMWM